MCLLQNDNTPLHIAAVYDVNSVKSLLDAGAKVNAKNNVSKILIIILCVYDVFRD